MNIRYIDPDMGLHLQHKTGDRFHLSPVLFLREGYEPAWYEIP